MDHLPYPKNAASPPIKVPYICSALDEYDGLDFPGYPVRRGWSRSSHNSEWMDCSLEEVGRRAQNWLYFGLLQTILGDAYNKEAFLTSDSVQEGFFISTSRLKEILVKWASSVQWKDLIGASQEISEPKGSFRVFDGVFKEADWQSDLLDAKSKCQIITCGIKLLIEFMRRVIVDFDDRKKASIYQFNLVPPRILVNRMLERGWCPHQIKILFPNHSGSLMYYLSGLSRQKMNVNHQHCPASSCTAHNVDFTNYTVRHVRQGCSCQFYGPDIKKVMEIIQEGDIPLMSLKIKHDGSPHLNVIRSKQAVGYTTISHVWSGGLGGIYSNKLPSCQLMQIDQYLRKLNRYRENEHIPCGWFERLRIPYIKEGIYIGRRGPPRWDRLELHARRVSNSLSFFNHQEQDSVDFWMDTLCIPVGEANISLRAKSIQKMDLIYAGAQASLVLDPELQQIAMKELSEEQLNIHVKCSAWMTRCWTLQEARLSREWYAQFADGLYDPIRARTSAHIVSDRAKQKAKGDNAISILADSITWFHSMLPMQRTTVFLNPDEDELYDREIFENAWNDLSERSTSKPEDILGILANLLNLSAGEVVALPYEQRLKAIIRAHQTLPTDILYNPFAKIQDGDNRWVPLTVGDKPFPGLYGEIRFAPDHMILNNSSATPVGFLVDNTSPRLEKFRLVDPISKEVLYIRLVDDGANFDYKCHSGVATCYIMGDLKASTLDRNSGKDWHGARFSVQKEEGSTLYLKYEYSLIYRHKDSPHQNNMGFDYPIIEAQRTTDGTNFRLDCGQSYVALNIQCLGVFDANLE